MGAPGVARKLIHGAVVGAEAAVGDEAETEALVETAGAGVFAERIDDDRVNGRIGETAGDGETHHLRAVAAAERVGLADPKVDCAMAGRDVAPVACVFACGIDDFEEADRTSIDFGDEGFAPVGRAGERGFPLSVVVGIGRDDMRFVVPATKQRGVGECGGTERDDGQRDGAREPGAAVYRWP